MSTKTILQSISQLHSVKAFMLALSLLTRFPIIKIDNVTANDSGRSALFYPLVGLLIGLVLYLPVVLFSNSLPMMMAAIIIMLWAVITGGLHLDGLADSADGWLGGMGDEEKSRSIMKDPLVGTAGVIAIVCLLLLKFSALVTLFYLQQGWLVIMAPLIGRSMILLIFNTTPYARNKGLASQIVEYLPQIPSWWVIGVCLVAGFILSIWGMLFVLLGVWLLRRMMIKQLGGCTGDTVGATVEIAEMLWLVGSVIVV